MQSKFVDRWNEVANPNDEIINTQQYGFGDINRELTVSDLMTMVANMVAECGANAPVYLDDLNTIQRAVPAKNFSAMVVTSKTDESQYYNRAKAVVLCAGEYKTENMTFGEALRHAIAGKKITRAGWNGKNLFVVYQRGYPEGIPCNKQTAEAWGMEEGDLFKCEPYLQINTVDGSHAMWVPSIRDCLAEDWSVVDG